MNSSLFKKKQLQFLAAKLKCSVADILLVTENPDDYYNEWIEYKINKLTGQIKNYRDGTPKKRIINPALSPLKEIQNKIKRNLLSTILFPKEVHGGVKGKSNITNAQAHKGNKYKFVTDLQDFFPNISSRQVMGALLKLGYSNHFASWLTKLTTYKHYLPQGASTSTHIANIVFLETDKKIIEFCEKNSITYTRFVDDLNFSSPVYFGEHVQSLLSIILNDGFKISRRKTNMNWLQNMTGIDVYNNGIYAPEKIKLKVAEEELNNCERRPYSIYNAQIEKVNKGK